MKKLLLITFAIAIFAGNYACNAQTTNKEEAKSSVAQRVDVYYFHSTRRCVTCNAVEAEAKKALETLYPEQLKNGTISFASINLDEAENKPLAQKCKAAGTALIVISGEKRTDLTSQGFMNARSNPDKLKEEIKKAIDPLLASK
jgi:hypothetical protein